MDIKFDFHMHSNYSKDGELTIDELLAMAKAKNLKYLALTDHNENKGIDKMIAKGKENGIVVIPAIEFDTCLLDHDVHLLGYGIDYHNSYLDSLSQKINDLMDDALQLRVEKLYAKYGIKIDLEKCINEANGGNPFFNIIDDLLNDPKAENFDDLKPYRKGGNRSDMSAVNFFWDKCTFGTDLFVKVAYPDFASTVNLIHELGGIAILAHPYNTFYHQDNLLKAALDAKIDGIECFSNYHNHQQNMYYLDYCRKNNLLVSGGSDFHGKHKPHIKMGEFGLTIASEEILEPFLRKLNVKN